MVANSTDAAANRASDEWVNKNLASISPFFIVKDLQGVAIVGSSYGGYATLVGLTFTPDIFECGVDIVGPSNPSSIAVPACADVIPGLSEALRAHNGK